MQQIFANKKFQRLLQEKYFAIMFDSTLSISIAHQFKCSKYYVHIEDTEITNEESFIDFSQLIVELQNKYLTGAKQVV